MIQSVWFMHFTLHLPKYWNSNTSSSQYVGMHSVLNFFLAASVYQCYVEKKSDSHKKKYVLHKNT